MKKGTKTAIAAVSLIVCTAFLAACGLQEPEDPAASAKITPVTVESGSQSAPSVSETPSSGGAGAVSPAASSDKSTGTSSKDEGTIQKEENKAAEEAQKAAEEQWAAEQAAQEQWAAEQAAQEQWAAEQAAQEQWAAEQAAQQQWAAGQDQGAGCVGAGALVY